MTGRRQDSARRIYGRRKGHRLSPRRQRLLAERLPALRLDVSRPAPRLLQTLFPHTVRDVWLEIGFGAGEHLTAQARANPDVGIIGCEPFVDGVAKLLTRIEDHALENVRIFDDDARPFLDWLPPRSLGRVFVLFPDPWPKKRHHNRRLLSDRTFEALARVMRSGAELRVASDIGDYVGFALDSVRGRRELTWTAERAADWRDRAADWPETRYERKALREGRRPYYLTFVRH